MTKRLRNILIILLSAMIVSCAAILLIPRNYVATVKAAEADTPANDYTEEWTLADNNFAFTQGAALNFLGPEEGFRMRFELNMKNADFKDLKSFPELGYRQWWGTLSDTYFFYEFTLYRGNNLDYSSSALHSFAVLLQAGDMSGSFFNGYVLEKERSVYSEAIGFEGLPEMTDIDHSKAGQTFNKGGCPLNKYKIIYTFKTYANSLFSVDPEKPDSFVWVKPLSNFSNYFITFHYGYNLMTFTGVFTTNYELTEKTIASSSRSIHEVLTNMDEAGMLDIELSGEALTYANTILNVSPTENITINYLQSLDGLPFAIEKSATVTVPVIDNDINIDDVNDYLYSKGKPIIESKCISSNLYDIVYNPDTDEYDTYYLKNVWLRTITTDGNYYDYFLDINNSYYEFYKPIVDTGAMTQDLFEYFYSTKILNKVPALSGYTTDELHGYFGFAVIPQTLTLDTLFAEVLDIDQTRSGIISYFAYSDKISFEAHAALLDNYNYSWLSKAWDGLAGFVSGGNWDADYYILYTDSDDGYIGQGGQTDPEDPDGVIKEEIVNPIIGSLKDLWDNFTGNGFISILKIILVIVVSLLVVSLIVKIIDLFKSSKRRR